MAGEAVQPTSADTSQKAWWEKVVDVGVNILDHTKYGSNSPATATAAGSAPAGQPNNAQAAGSLTTGQLIPGVNNMVLLGGVGFLLVAGVVVVVAMKN